MPIFQCLGQGIFHAPQNWLWGYSCFGHKLFFHQWIKTITKAPLYLTRVSVNKAQHPSLIAEAAWKEHWRIFFFPQTTNSGLQCVYKQVKNKSNTKILLLLQIGRLENEEKKRGIYLQYNVYSWARTKNRNPPNSRIVPAPSSHTKKTFIFIIEIMKSKQTCCSDCLEQNSWFRQTEQFFFKGVF